MKNWSISRQIGVAFSLVLVMLCAVGYQGYASLLSVVDHSRKSDDMQAMIQNLLEARRNEKNLILRKQSVYRDQTLASIAAIQRQVQEDQLHFAEADNKALMVEIAASVTEYETAFHRYSDLLLGSSASLPDASQGVSSQASQPSPELVELDKQMVASARKAQASCETAIQDQRGEMAQAVTIALRRILAVSILAVLLSVLCLVLIVRGITGSIQKLVGTADHIAEGDLTVKLADGGAQEIRYLANAIQKMSGQISIFISTIIGTAAKVAVFAHRSHAVAERLAERAKDVSLQATTVASSQIEMSATSTQIAQSCQLAAGGAQRATRSAENGLEVADKTMRIMGQIAERVQESARTIESLGERSHQIGSIVNVINEIASQTNLLALNAAIEAARAGQQGKGFAVVADEVRRLAERTTGATCQIGDMIQAIQSETEAAVQAMKRGVEQVEAGTAESAQSSEALHEMVGQVSAVSAQIEQIATAVEEQTSATAEISTSIEKISSAIQMASEEALESCLAASSMNHIGEELMAGLGQFKLYDDPILEINKAKAAHMVFIGKIKGHMDGSAKIDGNALPTRKTCAFGKWYQDKGHECCGEIGMFREIDAPHGRVHELGKQAIREFDAGKKEEALQTCAAMVKHSESLIVILDNLIDILSNNKKQSASVKSIPAPKSGSWGTHLPPAPRLGVNQA